METFMSTPEAKIEIVAALRFKMEAEQRAERAG
jgi:hypothetical protein